METLSIVIATYGDKKWHDLAIDRALPSAAIQGADEVLMYHDPHGTAASCKNDAVARAKGNWIVFCDADDLLEPGYIDAIKSGKGGLRYPRVRYVPINQKPEDPYPDPIILDRCSAHLRECNLLRGNFMVIGSAFRKEDFLKVGGFKEWESWEDWYLFLQLTYIGVVPMLCTDAIYRVHQHSNSRVSVPDPMKLFLYMRDKFREWALAYNGGQTDNANYRKFILEAP